MLFPGFADAEPGPAAPLRFLHALIQLPWSRLLELPLGEQIGLACLGLAVLLGGSAALGRLMGMLEPPQPRSRKRGWGPKAWALLLVALLPGGLVASAGVAVLMGRKDWRLDAIRIVGLSIIPGILLAWLSSPYFPIRDWSEHQILSGVLGLSFGLPQLWALIKLLRQTWGEPDSKVPWWPPLALWMQLFLLAGLLAAVLLPQS